MHSTVRVMTNDSANSTDGVTRADMSRTTEENKQSVLLTHMWLWKRLMFKISLCSWMIRKTNAPRRKKKIPVRFISLVFVTLGGVLFVADGDSRKGPQLASHNANSPTSPIFISAIYLARFRSCGLYLYPDQVNYEETLS